MMSEFANIWWQKHSHSEQLCFTLSSVQSRYCALSRSSLQDANLLDLSVNMSGKIYKYYNFSVQFESFYTPRPSCKILEICNCEWLVLFSSNKPTMLLFIIIGNIRILRMLSTHTFRFKFCFFTRTMWMLLIVMIIIWITQPCCPTERTCFFHNIF